jgi:hypothetical protein
MRKNDSNDSERLSGCRLVEPTSCSHAAERHNRDGRSPAPSTWSPDPDLGDNREETDEDGNVRIAYFNNGNWKSGVKYYSTVGAWLARQRIMQAGGTRLDAEYEAEEWNRTHKVYEERRPQGKKDEYGRPTVAPQGASWCKPATAVVLACAVVSQPVRCTPTCALQPA